MRIGSLIVIAALGLTGLAPAEPITFTVSGGEGNLIQFQSKAPLETVTGTTREVSGEIILDPADLSTGVSATIKVNAASLKTGNGIRDGHMKDNHLETDKYPDIIFKLNKMPFQGAMPPGARQNFTASGEFILHGVTRTIDVPAEVTYVESGSEKKLHIAATFDVKLSDYSIPRPQFLIMRLDDAQHITVDFWGSAK